MVHLILMFGYFFWNSSIMTCHGCVAMPQKFKVILPLGTSGEGVDWEKRLPGTTRKAAPRRVGKESRNGFMGVRG